jgi:NAD(P)-dependent dehydrogenase (short-subunit alcohol dehydrogenase family)
MKTALVTGASGGIGQALCLAYRRAGYRVIATDLKGECEDADVSIQGDLIAFARDDAFRSGFLADLRDAIGSSGLSALVNNAALQIVRTSAELSVRDWQRTLDTNLLAPFLLIQGFLPELKQARGCAINIASIHARLTKPGFACYATSKAALVGMTRSLAVDLAGSVRVNAISPAATATPMLVEGFEGREEGLEALAGMHPSGRIAEPSEVARAAVFLASDEAAFINGAVLDVDGAIGARLHDPE